MPKRLSTRTERGGGAPANSAGDLLGRVAFYRSRGNGWLEALKPVALAALAGGSAVKYLTGWETRWAVGIMVAAAIFWQVAAVLLGWLERRTGATEAHYRAATQTDPYRSESLSLLREIRDRLPRG